LLISFIHNSLMIFLTTIFSIAGFASMILFYYDLKKQVSPPDSMIVLEIDFLIPYFAVLVLLFVYIVFSFYILTMKKI